MTSASRTYVISHEAFACATKGLNGKGLSFFHLGLVAALDDRDALTAVYGVLIDVVSVQVADAFHRKRRSTDLDLVALHHLLDGRTDITHPDVNASFLSEC